MKQNKLPESDTKYLQEQEQQSDNNNDNDNNNEKKTYVKVVVGFLASELLQDMKDLNYNRLEEVQRLIDHWVEEHFSKNSKRINLYCQLYTMALDLYFIMDKLLNHVVILTVGSSCVFKFSPLLDDCIRSLLLNKDENKLHLDPTPFKVTQYATIKTI